VKGIYFPQLFRQKVPDLRTLSDYRIMLP